MDASREGVAAGGEANWASEAVRNKNAAKAAYRHYISDMAPKRPHVHLPYAVEAARLLGAQIRLARRERRWSQDELAERAGITTRTVYKIEHGDLSVRLGSAFEAAALLGVPLFSHGPTAPGAA